MALNARRRARSRPGAERPCPEVRFGPLRSRDQGLVGDARRPPGPGRRPPRHGEAGPRGPAAAARPSGDPAAAAAVPGHGGGRTNPSSPRRPWDEGPLAPMDGLIGRRAGTARCRTLGADRSGGIPCTTAPSARSAVSTAVPRGGRRSRAGQRPAARHVRPDSRAAGRTPRTDRRQGGWPSVRARPVGRLAGAGGGPCPRGCAEPTYPAAGPHSFPSSATRRATPRPGPGAWWR